MTSNLHIKGVTDEQTTCDKCGRIELRRTCIVVDENDVETGRYGTSCVSKIVGRKVTSKDADRIDMDRRYRLRAAKHSLFRAIVDRKGAPELRMYMGDIRREWIKDEASLRTLLENIRLQAVSARA